MMNVLSHQCQIEQGEQAFFNKTHSSFDKASKANCYDQGLFMTAVGIVKNTLNSVSHLCVLFQLCDFSISSCFNPGGVLEDKGTISVLFWSHANDFQSIMDWLCCSVSVSTIHNGRLWQNVIRNISPITSCTFTHAQCVLILLEAQTNTRCGYFSFLYRYSWLNLCQKGFI